MVKFLKRWLNVLQTQFCRFGRCFFFLLNIVEDCDVQWFKIVFTYNFFLFNLIVLFQICWTIFLEKKIYKSVDFLYGVKPQYKTFDSESRIVLRFFEELNLFWPFLFPNQIHKNYLWLTILFFFGVSLENIDFFIM